MACLLSTLFLLFPLGLINHAVGQEPILLILALLGLGLSAGPIQPINAELAVDVTYPTDETAVESTQQIGGNLASALLVPIVEMASRNDFVLFDNNPILEGDMRGDVLLLIGITILTIGFFNSFDSPLLRTIADTEDVIMEVNGKALDVTHTGQVLEKEEQSDVVTRDKIVDSAS
jgi:FLVCR family feline leukemia virus subgroup C receptor-related protein